MPIDREAAIRQLAASHSDLVAFIVLIGRDFHLAEDIYQDVLVEAMRSEGGFESTTHLLRWARKIARNRVIDASRRDERRRTIFDAAVLDLIESDWDSARPMSEAAMSEALHACLSELGESGRELIALRYRDDLDGAQIAERLGRPRASIYTSLSRLHRALGDCVKRRLAPGGER